MSQKLCWETATFSSSEKSGGESRGPGPAAGFRSAPVLLTAMPTAAFCRGQTWLPVCLQRKLGGPCFQQRRPLSPAESPEGVVGRPQLLKERIGQMSGVRNKNSTGIWRQLQNGCLDSLPARLFSERGLSSQQRAARHARPPCVAWWLWSGHLWVAELELCPGLGLGPCWVRHFLVWPVPHKRES